MRNCDSVPDARTEDRLARQKSGADSLVGGAGARGQELLENPPDVVILNFGDDPVVSQVFRERLGSVIPELRPVVRSAVPRANYEA